MDDQYRPKPAYYVIKRSLQPVSIGMKRTVTKNRENDRTRQFYEYGAFQFREGTIEIWACNSRTETRTTLYISAVDLNSDWRYNMPKKEVVLAENSSTELWSGACPQPQVNRGDKSAPSGTVVVHAKLVAEDGEVLARYSDWPQPYKLLELPDPGLEVKVQDDKAEVIVKRPAKGVWLDLEGDEEGVEWEDNSVS